MKRSHFRSASVPALLCEFAIRLQPISDKTDESDESGWRVLFCVITGNSSETLSHTHTHTHTHSDSASHNEHLYSCPQVLVNLHTDMKLHVYSVHIKKHLIITRMTVIYQFIKHTPTSCWRSTDINNSPPVFCVVCVCVCSCFRLLFSDLSDVLQELRKRRSSVRSLKTRTHT